nr:EOG090X04KW [Sida crystallina]
MMRRPYTQLVDQGIMPPLKTPAVFHEQRQKLQRAKMGDLLKHKIQHRPDRTELIRQHILEADTGKVDPSLAERQRMLKRARLADSLNDQLSHRPGPLELIQKNILHTDENVERAVKEGQIAFRATCEGAAARPTHPFRYVTPEGDDSSSEGTIGGLSPSQDGSMDGCSIPGTSTASNGTANSPMTMMSSLSPLSSVASPAATVTSSVSSASSHLPMQQVEPSASAAAAPASALPAPPQPPPPPPPPPPLPAALLLPVTTTAAAVSVPTSVAMKSTSESSSSGSSSRNRKKSKQKCPPKPRTIKFHEYKGPPNAQKQQQVTASEVETSYELLLQQQQLFLQWQLEWQHKYPQIILPASQKPPTATGSSPAHSASADSVPTNLASFLAVSAPGGVLTAVPIAAAPSPASQPSGPVLGLTSVVQPQAVPPQTQQTNASPPSDAPVKIGVRLEEMKVSDLKAELKKRNLPVSGSKPQLLERLRPFSNEDGTLSSRAVSRRGSQSQMQQTICNIADEGPVPSPPTVHSNSSRRVSCSSLDGSVSSFRIGSNSDGPIPSLSPSGSAVSMSPSPASIRPPSVINMDVDMEMNELVPTPTSTPAPVLLSEDQLKQETPPSPPPLPLFGAQQRSGQVVKQEEQQQQEISDLVRGLQEEQKALLEQQQLLRQQAASAQTTEETTASVNDPKAQQRLLLQQHIQLKMQQQQIQQQLQQLQHQQQQLPQLPSASPSSPISPTATAASKTTSRPTHARPIRQTGKLQQPASARIQSQSQQAVQASSPTSGSNDAVNQPAEPAVAQSKADVEPQSLPVFSNMFPPSQPVAGNRPPPPDYSEASRLLQQQQQQKQPASNSQKPRVYIKSQLVDDVLDILIRNGELPPSAAHDPVTPTTPRITLNALPFPVSSALNGESSRDPPPPPPPLPSHLLTKSSHQTPVSSSVDIKFPDIDINELGLDLESLGEAMELGVYDSHMTSNGGPMLSMHPPPPPHNDDNDDVTAMELDVSDWLDTLLPPLGSSQCMLPSSSSSSASSSTSGFSSLGSDGHQNYLLSSSLPPQQPANYHLNQQHQTQQSLHYQNQQQQHQQQNQQQQHLHQTHVTGDPLFSSLTSDPYTDLFALEDGDLKLPTGLGNPLSWDRLDFTA